MNEKASRKMVVTGKIAATKSPYFVPHKPLSNTFGSHLL